jgi:hypothetical protein
LYSFECCVFCDLFHVYDYSNFCINIEIFKDMTPHRHIIISHQHCCENLQSHYFRNHILYIQLRMCLCTRIGILWIFNTFLTLFSLCCFANACCSVYHIKQRRTFPIARLINMVVLLDSQLSLHMILPDCIWSVIVLHINL